MDTMYPAENSHLKLEFQTLTIKPTYKKYFWHILCDIPISKKCDNAYNEGEKKH